MAPALLVSLSALLIVLIVPAATATRAAPLVFSPSGDATLRQSRPDQNYGAASSLEVDLSSRKDFLLRFDLQGSAGRPVVSAVLRLFVLDPSPIGGDVVLAGDSTWDESSVTWNTAPAGDGPLMGSLGGADAGSWVTLDVTQAVAGDGPVTFRVSSLSSNGADYGSREAPTGQRPELVVEFGDPAGDQTPPTTPTGLLAESVSPNLVRLSWDPSSDAGGIAGYDVYRDGTLLASDWPDTTYEDATVVGATDYTYWVHARDLAGWLSDPSDPLQVTTPSGDAEPPTAPTALEAMPQCAFRLPGACYALAPVEVELHWQASTDDVAVVAYDVYRDGAWLATVHGLATSYEDFTALPDATYAYQVQARDESGRTSPPSNLASATTAGGETVAPAAPAWIRSDVGPVGGVSLTWGASSDNTAVTGYVVYRDGSPLGTVEAGTSFLDAAGAGGAHSYYVRARDAFGNLSDPSKSTSLTVPESVPPLTLYPSADATIREASPTRNYGSNVTLEVDQSSRKDILLRFDVPGLQGHSVVRATLRLWVVDPSPVGGNIARASSTNWNESTVTWASAPASAEGIAAFGGVASGRWVEADVTPAVSGEGPLALRISSESSNGADYAAREDPSGHAPQLVLEFAPPPPSTDGQPSFPIRAAFYYPWFPQTWTVNGAHVFYHPDLGYYSSDDATVQRAHIEALSAAGLDAAISSWWGFPDTRDDRLQQLLAQTEALGSPLKWTAYHEGEGRADPTPDELAVDLTHLGDLATSPSYLRVDGRFVVFVYNADADDSCDVAERWTQANALIGGQAYIVLKIFPGWASCPVQPDSWHEYAPAKATDHRVGQSYTISPGFWRADEAQPRLGRDLTRWRQNVLDMVASQEPWQLVTTFNEWGEGTAVEASTEWGSTYLEALADVLAPRAPSEGTVIAGAGDIGQSPTAGEATANLLEGIRPSIVFTTGDNAYPVASLADFAANYDPTWGRLRAITRPVPGNHEYLTPAAADYFAYFGSAAGTAGEGWYAYDVGDWRAYALNSNCSEVGCDIASAQYQWLAADLAANPRRCTLAIWHHPRFAAGTKSDDLSVAPLWALLQSAGAELVLNGHDHNYQRYAPQDADGNLDYPNGTIEIIVGTGGAHELVDAVGTNRLAASADSRGVLKLTLSTDSFTWEFVPEFESAFHDSGTATCH